MFQFLFTAIPVQFLKNSLSVSLHVQTGDYFLGEYVTDRMQSKYPTQNGNKMAKMATITTTT